MAYILKASQEKEKKIMAAMADTTSWPNVNAGQSVRRSRWAKTKAATEEREPATASSTVKISTPDQNPPPRAVAATLYADALFGNDAFVLSARNRQNMATELSETKVSTISPQLKRDAVSLKHSCIYVPGFAAAASTCWRPSNAISEEVVRPPTFDLFMSELGPSFKMSPYRRSKHPAITDDAVFRKSNAYNNLRKLVKKRFPDLKIGYSIINLYRNGGDCTEMHRDNFQKGGNRQMDSSDDEDHADQLRVAGTRSWTRR